MSITMKTRHSQVEESIQFADLRITSVFSRCRGSADLKDHYLQYELGRFAAKCEPAEMSLHL